MRHIVEAAMKSILSEKVVVVGAAVLVFVLRCSATVNGADWESVRANWHRWANRIKDVQYVDDGVVGTVSGGDPFFVVGCVPSFEATDGQAVLFRARCGFRGSGHLYWATDKVDFSANRCMRFVWDGDDKIHEFRLKPDWKEHGRITGLRIDFPDETPAGTEVALEGLRIVPSRVGDIVREKRKPRKVDLTNVPPLVTAKPGPAPEPRPAKTEFSISAIYYPGWWRLENWRRIRETCPERRPLLGWYDDHDPNVVDWQIKWLVEHGITSLFVDWYWDGGKCRNEVWIDALRNARHRRYIKWAVFWCNHGGKGTHSVEDQRIMTKYWIDRYFNMPEYLKVDGCPAVWIWEPANLSRDVPDGGCRRLLDISRQMAREAGYKGIHFIAMKWPEADNSPDVLRGYKNMGFDEVGIYRYISHGGKAEDPYKYPYSLVADGNIRSWDELHEANVMPFLPNLSTGWDDRPWNDGCEIFGRTPAEFRRVCMAARAFADRTGVKRLCLGPLNEWGEGSYAEPNDEYGFGMYEAVRDAF